MRLRIVGCAMGSLLLAPGSAPAVEKDQLEEILVTGSRIPDTAVALGRSVVIIDRTDLSRFGVESVGEMLQQLPLGSGSPANANANAAREDRGGDGSTRIDLRGLGAERTLVLVDGRRIAPGGLGADSSVDLGMIPVMLVERIEVLGMGSSAVYGSDAIGGVVNVVTRRGRDADTELVLSGSTTSRGDGGSLLAGLMGNHVHSSGAVSAGMEFFEQQSVWMRDRNYSRQREALLEDGSVIEFGLAQTAQGLFRVPPSNSLGIAAGAYTRVEGSGEPTTGEDFRPFVDPDDRYNPNAEEYLRTPLTRWSLWLDGEQRFGDELRLDWSGWVHRRRSEQMLRPAPLDTRFGIGVPLLEFGLPGIPRTNLYNPFGIDLRDVRRRVVEAGRRHFEQDVDAGRAVATLHGPGGSRWDWQVGLGWSGTETDQSTSGELRNDRTELALGPSGLDAEGRSVCGEPDPQTGRVAPIDVVPGCVPLNVFGGQGPDGLGTIDAAQLDYVTGRFRDRGRNEQWIAEAVVRGHAAGLTTGPVGWVAGVELRRDSGYQRLDARKRAGVSGSISGGVADNVSNSAREAYAELRVPLVADRRAVELFDVDLGLRWSDFTSFGSTTNLSGRIRWRPRATTTLWAAYSDVFRAPTLASLYASNVRFLGLARDPCGNDPSAEQRVNCAANGVPDGSYEQSRFDLIPSVKGGNADLGPEEGRSWSAGIEWSSAGGRLMLQAGYFDTVVDDAIHDPLDQTLLDECANTGVKAVCARITRWPDGTVRELDDRYLNLGAETARGVDLAARYRVEGAYGHIRARLLATHLLERSITIAPGSSTLELAGTRFGPAMYPEWRGVAGLDWGRAAWSAAYGAEYLGAARECSDGPPVLAGLLTGCRQIADVLYHDLSFAYAVPAGWTVTALVTNLTDQDPPRVAYVPVAGNTSPVNYRLLGRTYSLQLRYRTH